MIGPVGGITFGKSKVVIVKKKLHSKQSKIIPKGQLYDINLKRKGFINYLIINNEVAIKWCTFTKNVFSYRKMG